MLKINMHHPAISRLLEKCKASQKKAQVKRVYHALRRRIFKGGGHLEEVILPNHSSPLTQAELVQGKRICDEVLESVRDRLAYIEENGLDKEFALPDANWIQDPSNEQNRVFKRICKCAAQDLQYLRAFCITFSGFSLFDFQISRGRRASNLTFTDQFLEEVSRNLHKWNPVYMDGWNKIVRGVPRRYLLRPPLKFGECGQMIGDVLVNCDTYTYQERINILQDTGMLRWLEERYKAKGTLRVLEIGGGYGAIAYWFLKTFPGSSYTIADLPESLLFSRLYLSLSRSDLPTSYGLAPAEGGVRFLPNYMVEQLDEPFDIVINTLSFSEMSTYQVERYGELIKERYIRDGGILFEQNQDNRHLNFLFASDIFKELFPYNVSFANNGIKYMNGVPNLWSNDEIHLGGPVTK